MSVPIFIEPVINREQGDCAIACLVMWTGKSYQDAIAAAPAQAHKRGMCNREIIATAAKLGARLTARRQFNANEDDGILTLNPWPKKKGRQAHAVVLLGGKVLDPYNGRLWLDVDVFLQTERYKTGALLAEDE